MKQNILENLGNGDVFCIKVCSQKNYVAKVLGTSTGLFWRKKGMSQHVDVIYIIQDNEIKKYVCFTLLQKCEQSLAQTLSVVEHVCQQIKTDFPKIKNLY